MMNERFRVEWEETAYDAYDFACREFPEKCPKINDFVTKYKGTVYSIIEGGFLSPDMFLICKDDDNTFIKVPIEKCKRIY